MNNSEIRNNIIELIKISRIDKAIECLLENTISEELKDDLLNLLSRLNRNNKEFQQGLLTQEDKNVTENRIVQSLIACLNELYESENFISKRNLSIEKANNLKSQIKHRENSKRFLSSSSSILNDEILKIFDNLNDILSKIKDDTVNFDVQTEEPNLFRQVFRWETPQNQHRSFLIRISASTPKVSDAKLMLDLLPINLFLRKQVILENNPNSILKLTYKAELNNKGSICWRGKDETLDFSDVVDKCIHIMLEYYDKNPLSYERRIRSDRKIQRLLETVR